jgi:outer membrane murein-binding lipoprotein Lpp
MKQVLVVLTALLISSCASPAKLDEAQARASELQVRADQQEAVISALRSQVDGLKTQLSTAQSDLDNAKSENDSLQTELSAANSSLSKLRVLANKLTCQDEITDMKYENILDASTIMAAWWARQPDVERVQGTYRDSIWSNADTKVHAVRYISSDDGQPYVEHFLVYFPEFDMNPGVFWVKGQCWLDVP